MTSSGRHDSPALVTYRDSPVWHSRTNSWRIHYPRRRPNNWRCRIVQESLSHSPELWIGKMFWRNYYVIITRFRTPFINTLRPRQNVRRFADDTFKRIFLNENVRISIKISLKFVPQVPIKNIPALGQIMAWRRLGDKPLSEPMMVWLLTHICVIRPQWVNTV